MTRINTVSVRQLSRQHLQGEKKEITRVFGHVRKAQARGLTVKTFNGPENYVLGTGHVKFFYNKLKWIWDRYVALTGEMHRRGYNATLIPLESLMEGIDPSWFRTYTPTEADIMINRFRLVRRDKDDHYDSLDWCICKLTHYIYANDLQKRLAKEDLEWLNNGESFYKKSYQPLFA